MRKPNYTTEEQKQFLKDISEYFDTDVVKMDQINTFIKERSLPIPHFLINDKARNASWGKYRVRDTNKVTQLQPPVAAVGHAAREFDMEQQLLETSGGSLVPRRDPTYVPFGFYSDLQNIIDSKIFYPVYITGLSGNGKTLMVKEVCAKLGRELVRVNITKETDEMDLIGSHELINGNTVFREGPVIIAMKRGAILLLDETDYGSERLLCLQPILEGLPYYDKKTRQTIHPQPGFNVMATANTKGKGSSDGRFIGANTLNEAFLERFAITVEQEYPSKVTELKIVQKNFEELGLKSDSTFPECLVTWSENVRKAYDEGGVDEIISTRRLVHIAKAFKIFGTRRKALNMCLNRFDAETKESFLDFYTKVDEYHDRTEEQIAKALEATALRKKADMVTPKAPTPKVSVGISAMELLPLSATYGKRYGVNVSIVQHPSKDGVIVVSCHGQSHDIDTSRETLNSPRIADKIHAAIEINFRRAGRPLPKL